MLLLVVFQDHMDEGNKLKGVSLKIKLLAYCWSLSLSEMVILHFLFSAPNIEGLVSPVRNDFQEFNASCAHPHPYSTT